MLELCLRLYAPVIAAEVAIQTFIKDVFSIGRNQREIVKAHA
jgi:hypothetical protein